jgi:predicted permease
MANSMIEKALALLCLILVGYLFKRKFQAPVSISTIRNLILNVALPATIFLSTIEIKIQSNLFLLPVFALAVNIYLMIIGYLLACLLLKDANASQKRALILLFPSLAPGLTVYPFVEQFLGNQGLAWAALADTGNKLFVLVGLYALAIYWYGKAHSQVKVQWQSIGLFLLGEPVNIAIIIALLLTAFHLNAASLPFVLSDPIQKFSACTTPLILFYIGISLNLKSLQLDILLMILLIRAGTGFLFSAVMVAILHPASEITVLLIALPQASCSLWPLLHATRINDQNIPKHGDKAIFFDVNFATSLLALSFPFSILVLLIVFSSGSSFYSPVELATLGLLFLLLCGILFLYQQLPVRLQNPIGINISLRSPFRLKSEVVLNFEQQTSECWQQVELAQAEFSNVEGEQLKKLFTLLQRYLFSEINDQKISLQFHYSLRGETLIILGQHKKDNFIDLSNLLENLEKDIQQLNFNSINQIQLYFRIFGQKQPYISYCLEPNSRLRRFRN